MKPEPIPNFVFTPHAEFEIKRRGIDRELVENILRCPEQRIDVRSGRVVAQSKLKERESGKNYLIRVFVDVDRTPPEVVMAYKTSNILKYWV